MAILSVKGVNKRFGGLQALGDVNLDVAENTCHAIIGPNGAGKSTLLNVLVGKDKRRLEMAMCLVQEPRLLLLDEPTAGMARADTENTIELLKTIRKERGITMAIIEHDMNVVFSLAERITVLAQGTPLVEDVPDNIKGHPKVREAYLGEAQV